MDTNKMREQFEAALKVEISAQLMDIHPSISETDAHVTFVTQGWLARKGNTYELPVPAMAWWAWQASREAVVVELPRLTNPRPAGEHSWHNIRNESITACRRAIEAQGLKVTP